MKFWNIYSFYVNVIFVFPLIQLAIIIEYPLHLSTAYLQ